MYPIQAKMNSPVTAIDIVQNYEKNSRINEYLLSCHN